jgi:UDP-glucose 4-epimerase
MILLTGSGGFIGSHISDALSGDYELCLPTRQTGIDLTNYYHVKTLFEKDIDTIVHFAADPTTKPDQDNPFKSFDDNIRMVQNLLHHCKEGTRFIFASTILVYGNVEYAKETYEQVPTSIYGASKTACEALISAYKTLKGIKPVNLRLCATVGSGMTHGALKDIIRKTLQSNKPLELFGDEPGSIKPFIHVSDVCRAVKFFINNSLCDTYNLTPDDNISILRIANIVMEEINMSKEIKWLGSESVWKGDNPLLSFSNAKIQKAGFRINYTKSETVIRKAVNENIGV